MYATAPSLVNGHLWSNPGWLPAAVLLDQMHSPGICTLIVYPAVQPHMSQPTSSGSSASNSSSPFSASSSSSSGSSAAAHMPSISRASETLSGSVSSRSSAATGQGLCRGLNHRRICADRRMVYIQLTRKFCSWQVYFRQLLLAVMSTLMIEVRLGLLVAHVNTVTPDAGCRVESFLC